MIRNKSRVGFRLRVDLVRLTKLQQEFFTVKTDTKKVCEVLCKGPGRLRVCSIQLEHLWCALALDSNQIPLVSKPFHCLCDVEDVLSQCFLKESPRRHAFRRLRDSGMVCEELQHFFN